MENKNEIAAIGANDTIMLFNAVGIRTFQTADPVEVDRIVFKLVSENYKIIYVSEELYEIIPETLEKYKLSTYPIILPIPTSESSNKIGLKKLRENVEKAIGFDIF